MNVQINDPQLLISQAANLAQLASNIDRVQEDLTALSSKIGGAWSSDTVDKESYLSSLNTTLQRIGGLTGILMSLSKKLETYVVNQMQNANNVG